MMKCMWPIHCDQLSSSLRTSYFLTEGRKLLIRNGSDVATVFTPLVFPLPALAAFFFFCPFFLLESREKKQLSFHNRSGAADGGSPDIGKYQIIAVIPLRGELCQMASAHSSPIMSATVKTQEFLCIVSDC